MIKVKITVKLETSDHDGYCSGNESEYKSIIKKYIRNIKSNDISEYNDAFWIHLLPEPKINYWNSYYCDNSKDSIKYGLEKHEFRYTILKVEIIK
jgi:hypothetical protein